MTAGRFRRSRPAAVVSGLVAAVVAAAVALGLAATASGCESCQPSDRYYKRQIRHELHTRLCARNSYYLECASTFADPGPGVPAVPRYDGCRDLVSTLMSMCGDVDWAPDPDGLSLREAWLSCLWGTYERMSITLTMAGVGGRTDGRCGDPLLWDEFPADRREAELRNRRQRQ